MFVDNLFTVIDASSAILRYAYRSLVEHCSKAVMTSELEDLILEFPLVSLCKGFIAACAEQGFCTPFINTFEVYMFLVKFLTYLKSSVCNETICSFVILTIFFAIKPFQAAERLREHHIKVLDYFFKAQLDIYYQHPQLTTYVAFLDIKEAWTIYKDGKKKLAYEDQIVYPTLEMFDATLERLDERGLSLHKVVDSHNNVPKVEDIRFLDENKRICDEYRELLLEFLKNPARAGRHVLNGARFATASFYCLQQVSVGQTRKLWYTMFLCAAAYIPHSSTLECRYNSLESLQLALIYIRLLLPRSSISEELINLSKNYTFERKCTQIFTYDTRLAQDAIKNYLARSLWPSL
jgi:hypothetical protein